MTPSAQSMPADAHGDHGSARNGVTIWRIQRERRRLNCLRIRANFSPLPGDCQSSTFTSVGTWEAFRDPSSCLERSGTGLVIFDGDKFDGDKAPLSGPPSSSPQLCQRLLNPPAPNAPDSFVRRLLTSRYARASYPTAAMISRMKPTTAINAWMYTIDFGSSSRFSW